jgi:hypothetical protein
MQAIEKGLKDVGGAVADGEDFARLFDLGRDAFGFDESDEDLRGKRCNRGVEELTGRAVSGDDAAGIGGLRQVAAGAAGHQNFHAGAAIFFDQQRFQAPRGGTFSGDEAGSAGADHDDLPMGFCGVGNEAPLYGGYGLRLNV